MIRCGAPVDWPIRLCATPDEGGPAGFRFANLRRSQFADSRWIQVREASEAT